MALTKVINDLADLNQSGSTNALKGCVGDTSEQPAISSSIDYLIVGGGGGNGTLSGGAGAGGLLTGTTTVYKGTPTVITVGKGGPAGPGSYPDPLYARNGNDSGFNGIRALGGGSGGSHGVTNYGIDGGSGGGAGSGTAVFGVGSGTSGQGMDGGVNAGNVAPAYGAGGGGGASTTALGAADGVGGTGTSSLGGTGGSGRNMNSFISSANANLAQIGDVSGSDVWFAGGGGGGAQSSSAAGTPYGGPTYPAYANGGGGHGGDASRINAQEGLRNTGGGAGGAGYSGSWGAGAEGGSGVAILKYDNTIVTGYSLNSEDTYTVNWPADKYGVAYWPLNLDVKDVGGNYDGTATDITYTNGKFNQAAVFNGTTSRIDVTSPIGQAASNENDDFTISIWVNFDTITGSVGTFNGAISGNGNGTTYSSFALYNYGASGGVSLALERYFNNTGYYHSSYTAAAPFTAVINTWYNIVTTYVGSTRTVTHYVDGIALPSYILDTNAGARTMSSTNAFGSYNGSTYGFDGKLEQFRIYKSILSSTDVQDIYNNSKPGSLPPLSSTAPTIDSLSFPSGVTTKALWDFNGDLIADPTTYNGSITSAISYATGKFTDQALYFSGAGGGLISTNYTRSGFNFTASLWVNLLDQGARQVFLGDGNSGGSDTSISITMQITYPGDVLKVFINSADGVSTGTSVTTSVDWNSYWGKWTHVAVTQNGSDVKIYVNGILVDTLNVTGSDILTGAAAQAIALGSWGPAASNSGETYGSINLMRFYDVTLTDQNIYDLWQKESNIQTHFTSGSTDTLVFKEGSGEITFTGDPEPGADIGMLRYNSTLGQMEHFNSGGWKDFTNCTTSMCNYPTTAAALYQFTNNCNDTCGLANGIPNSITYTSSGKYGQAGFFNGSGYVQIPYNFDFSGSFALSFWIRPNTVSNQWQSIIGTDGYGAATHSGFNFYLNYAVLEPWICVPSSCAGTGSGAVFQTGSVAVGVWQHIVLSRTYNSKWELFYNGSSLDTNTSQALTTDLTSQGASYIGTHPTSFTYEFNGDIDQVRIFTTDLTAAQVTQLYNETYCP